MQDEIDIAIEEALGGQSEPYDLSEKFWLAKPLYDPEFAAEVIERFEDHVERFGGSPWGQAIRTLYCAYHNIEANGSEPTVSIMEAGESGELLAMRVNHLRGLIKHRIAMVTAERAGWEPQARNADSEARRQVTLARNLLDFAERQGLEKDLVDQLEMCEVATAGFLVQGWNEQGGLNGEGSIIYRVLGPWEVSHERVRSYKDCTWWIWRAYESRWEWVARFAKSDPDKARKIAELDASESAFATSFVDDEITEDRIPVLYLYAAPTLAAPQGRLAIVADQDLVLLDGPMPYGREVPITRMASAEFLGTSIPYSDAWSLLPLQEAYNGGMGTVMTRVDAHGVPSISAPEGSEFEVDDFVGSRLLKHPPGMGEPRLLDMLQIPPGLLEVLRIVKQDMEELSGINSVTRGNPAENITSGSMAALVQSMAIQFNSSLERTFGTAKEQAGSHTISIYQRMATAEQIISIAGEDEQYTTQTFKGEDLKQIMRVTVKSASALSKTTAGRADMAEKLLAQGVLQDPREFLHVVQTGEYQSTLKTEVDELTIVKSENEMLMRGERPGAMTWDNHQLHIREHKHLLDTRARYDGKALQRINAHLKEHYDVWVQLSREVPDMLAAIGCPPLPQAQAMGQQAAMAMGAPPGPPQEGPPPQGGPGGGGGGPAPKKKGGGGMEPGRPSDAPAQPAKPAKDPMTGEAPVKGQ